LTLLEGYRVEGGGPAAARLPGHAGREWHLAQQREHGDVANDAFEVVGAPGSDDRAMAPGVAEAAVPGPTLDGGGGGGSDGGTPEDRPGTPANTGRGGGQTWSYIGLALLAAGLLIAIAALLVSYGLHGQMNELRSEVDELAAGLEASERRSAKVKQLESTLAYLVTRTDMLHDTVADLSPAPRASSEKAPEIAPDVKPDSPEAQPTRPQAELRRVGGTEKQGLTPSRQPPRETLPADKPAHGPPPESAVPAGASWDVILISLRNKDSADRLATKARALGMPVDKYPIKAGGRELWRLSVSGFPSADAARSYGDEAKAKLGLQDVWIVRR
jgi:cell division septation protein DedD